MPNKLWLQKALLSIGLILLIAVVVLSIQVSNSIAQSDKDWRASLRCPTDQQVHQGIFYCTGTDDSGSQVHVVVIDLKETGIAFEYILPKGFSDARPGCGQCQDPNVPAWGSKTAGGCYTAADEACKKPGSKALYPVMTLSQAVARAEEVRDSPPLAAIINADYAASNRTHGPEGLMVINGERLDGSENCDDDFNAVLRPWLGLGDEPDVVTSYIPAVIGRLTGDTDPVPQWMDVGIGGGPWLVREGKPVPGSDVCAGETTINVIPQIQNCNDNQKSRKAPIKESYDTGSCGEASHMAAGISQDQRWLFLVATTSDRTPKTITNFLINNLHVSHALKFDGGSSTHLYYIGQPPVSIDPEKKNRPLSNYLAVYAGHGEGIELPLEASTSESVLYKIITGETKASFTINMTNSGALSWIPEDGIALRGKDWFSPFSPAEDLPLMKKVSPGETATWVWETDTNKAAFERFQLVQNGRTFGPTVVATSVRLPEEWKDRQQEFEQKINQMIQEWKDQGREDLDELVKNIQKWVLGELNNLIRRAIDNFLYKACQALNNLCNSLGLLIGMAALIFWVRRQK